MSKTKKHKDGPPEADRIAPISVICPVYNSAAFVKKMFLTVISQSVLPAELCICDDGSSDGTKETIEDLMSRYDGPTKVMLLRSAHKGPGAARNLALKAATQKWVAFLDSDDEWEPEKIEAIFMKIEASPESNFFCHSEKRIDLTGEESISLYYKLFDERRPLTDQLYLRNFFSTSAVVCEAKLVDESGGFSETLMSAQDYELWLRLAPNISLSFLPEVLGSYIERRGNITNSNLVRRLFNEIRIAWQYRPQAKPFVFLYRVSRIFGSYGLQCIRRSRM